jgi:hypothetical protein
MTRVLMLTRMLTMRTRRCAMRDWRAACAPWPVTQPEWRESETESGGSVSENKSATPNGLNGGRIPRFERVLCPRCVHLRPPPDACSSSTLLARWCEGNESNDGNSKNSPTGNRVYDHFLDVACPGLPSQFRRQFVSFVVAPIPQSFAMLTRLLRPASNVFSQRAAMATIRNAKNPQV